MKTSRLLDSPTSPCTCPLWSWVLPFELISLHKWPIFLTLEIALISEPTPQYSKIPLPQNGQGSWLPEISQIIAIVTFRQGKEICLTSGPTNNNSFNKLEGSWRIGGHFSSLNQKTNLQSWVLQKNTLVICPFCWFGLQKPNHQMPLPTVTGHCCPH